MNRLALGAAGIIIGTVGVILLVWTLSFAVERLPIRVRRRAAPWVYVGPSVAVMTAMLVVPGALTIVNSFRDARSEKFVGIDNYRWLATDPQVRAVLVNNAMWLIIVPVTTVAWGLVIAVMADKLARRSESLAKSAVFLPVAISLVGASTIWGFVYAVRPEGRNQIGLLNELIVRMGGTPIAWLLEPAINDLALMVIMVWLETGFAMVILSAAIKAVPAETIEAARIDGASERQIFWRITTPQIKPTLIVVYTTVLISSLKLFDIVAVLTNGNFGTDVIAHRFIIELFRFRNFGHAAAIVVVLMIATTPFMALNIRAFRRQEQSL